MFKPLLLSASLMLISAAHAGTVVIGNANISTADAKEVKKVFLGKKEEIAGVSVTPVMNADKAATDGFFDKIIEQAPDAFNAYWAEKTFKGQGTKPKELANDAAVKAHIASTPGAIGYINDSSVDASVKVLIK